jgi:hypothetical protein
LRKEFNMRRGCISLGEVRCDVCQQTIPYPERYLAVDEENGVEVENGNTVHYCVQCALEKGYAHYREMKGEMILTFFPETEIIEEFDNTQE